MTKLEAVNDVLARVGLPPVPALDTGGASSHGLVESILDQEARRIQGDDWHFNRRYNVKLTPAGDKHIAVPANTIHIDTDTCDAHRSVAVIGDELYDLDNATLEFDDEIRVSYTLIVDWGDIPEAFQRWIVCEAAEKATRQRHSPGSRERWSLLQELGRDTRQARAQAQHENTRHADVNLLNTAEARDIKGRRYHKTNENYIA